MQPLSCQGEEVLRGYYSSKEEEEQQAVVQQYHKAVQLQRLRPWRQSRSSNSRPMHIGNNLNQLFRRVEWLRQPLHLYRQPQSGMQY